MTEPVASTISRVGGPSRSWSEELVRLGRGDTYWHVTVRDGAFHGAEGAPTAGPPPYDVYEVRPATAYAFGTEEPARSTRWRFGG